MLITIRDRFADFARAVNVFAASPGATALVFVLVVVWFLSGPAFHYSDFWQLLMNTTSSIITFLMVFVLNNAQSRDTTAMNAKLDMLIYSLEAADNRLIAIEKQSESKAQAVLEEFTAAVEEEPQ